MGLVVRMFHFETIASGLDIFVRGDLVARSVDVSFDLGLLKLKLVSAQVERPEKWDRTAALLLRIQ